MRRKRGRSAPAINSPLPPRVEWYRSVPCPAALKRCDALRWYENATEIGAVVTAAVEVAATGGHEPVAHGQAQAQCCEFRRMRGVITLDPDEPRFHEQRQQPFEIDRRGGVRE